jgi:tetratricopeptide (TPR) repeat protein
MLSSCGPEKTGFFARGYHNTTAFFNGYYNATVKYKEGVKAVEKTNKLKPEKLAGIFNLGEPSQAKTSYTLFDEAIKKCDMVLYRHPKSKKADDCRFLNGKSWFYKRNFVLAARNFEYVIEAYPKSKLLTDAKIWLAKTYYMQGYPDKTLDFVEISIKKPKLLLNESQQAQLDLLLAQIQIDDGEYAKAIASLEKNVAVLTDRSDKARIYFILGQLNQKLNFYLKAKGHYEEVIKLNVDYALTYASKIRIARLFIDSDNTGDRNGDIGDYLKKLLQDFKFQEFKDQTYYEMALLDLKKAEDSAAIKDLAKSLEASQGNIRQKTLSYYKTALIYFNNFHDYSSAQLYFDSAAAIVEKDAPEFLEIKTLASTLQEYINYLETITYQDSMLVLAAMAPEQRELLIDKVIAEAKKKKKEEEERIRLEKENAALNALDNNLFNSTSTTSASGFYFDNPVAVSNGRNEFLKLWGDRKNEDHWRRARKESIIPDAKDEKESEKDSTASLDPFDRSIFLKDIPLTAEAVDASNKLIMEAYFGLGQIYQLKLNQPDSASKYYNLLVNRYPESDLTPKSYYALYKIFQQGKKITQEGYYKDLILDKYPNSIFAKLIRQENVNDEFKALNQDFETAYKALYNSYRQKNYGTVIDLANFMFEKFIENKEIPKVYYLKGLAYGELYQIDSLVSIFTFLKQNFQDAEVTALAIKTLELLKSRNAQSTPDRGESKEELVKPPKSKDEESFKDFVKTKNPGDKIFVIALITKEDISNQDLKTKMSDFNKSNYGGDNLQSNVFLYRNYYLVHVNSFESFALADDYLTTLKDSEIGGYCEDPESLMAYVTSKNFQLAFSRQKIEDYMSFFKKYKNDFTEGN